MTWWAIISPRLAGYQPDSGCKCRCVLISYKPWKIHFHVKMKYKFIFTSKSKTNDINCYQTISKKNIFKKIYKKKKHPRVNNSTKKQLDQPICSPILPEGKVTHPLTTTTQSHQRCTTHLLCFNCFTQHFYPFRLFCTSYYCLLNCFYTCT